MTSQQPECPTVEIVERAKSLSNGKYPIKPNCLRINGQQFYVPRGREIIVNEMRFNGENSTLDEAVEVTVTFWAQRVEIKEELIEEDETP